MATVSSATSRRLLLVLGGIRVGDTFHMIPFLRHHAAQYAITWVINQYALEAAAFLQRFSGLGIAKLLPYKDLRHPPIDFSDRILFKMRYKNIIPHKDFDKVITDHTVTFDTAYMDDRNLGNHPHLTYLSDIKFPKLVPSPYIAVQADSIACPGWKEIPALFAVKFPLPIWSIGYANERIIPGSYRFAGTLSDIAAVLYHAQIAVCIHSAFACLRFYLNKPLVALHFTEGLFPFSRYHSNCIDLIKPTASEIEEAIHYLMQHNHDN